MQPMLLLALVMRHSETLAAAEPGGLCAAFEGLRIGTATEAQALHDEAVRLLSATPLSLRTALQATLSSTRINTE